MMCYRGGVPRAFSHDSAFPLRCLPGATPGKKRRKRNSCSQCSKGGLQTESGKGSQDGFLLPARGCIINIREGGEAGKVQWKSIVNINRIRQTHKLIFLNKKEPPPPPLPPSSKYKRNTSSKKKPCLFIGLKYTGMSCTRGGDTC